MNGVFGRLLSKLEITPVLVDVGASDSPPGIWDRIARYSTYVGFDPDLREIREVRDGRYRKSIIVNQAIVSDDRIEVPFYLTRSPFCSSTLKPDHHSLSNYLFSELFAVDAETTVRAASLDSVIDRLSLSGVDWLKIDSQGTDLRIFNSLRKAVRSRVLALDVEPGLIDAYVGEDLFVDAHRDLIQQGFWLSNLSVEGTPRVKTTTVSRLAALHKKSVSFGLLGKAVRNSPCWCEARYLRTAEWLVQTDSDPRDYVLLWVFAMLDGQPGFALDLAFEYESHYGQDGAFELMKEECLARVRRRRVGAASRSLGARVKSKAKRLWSSIVTAET